MIGKNDKGLDFFGFKDILISIMVKGGLGYKLVSSSPLSFTPIGL
jgi:hypothetical protein